MLANVTRRTALIIFFMSVLGGTLNPSLYFFGLKYTRATVATALTNLLPALTFILAAAFRLETSDIKTWYGKSKVGGTIVSIGGAMVMIFYRGVLIPLPHTDFHWNYLEGLMKEDTGYKRAFQGPLLVFGSCLSWAGWYTLRGKMSKNFIAPYTVTCTTSLLAMLQCGALAMILEHNSKMWSIISFPRLFAALFNGILGSAGTLLVSWCIGQKGPVYASAFSPLVLVIVALFSWLVLHQDLYLGSVLGAAFIVLGLYLLLWGKKNERFPEAEQENNEESGIHQEDEDNTEVQLDRQEEKKIEDAIVESSRTGETRNSNLSGGLHAPATRTSTAGTEGGSSAPSHALQQRPPLLLLQGQRNADTSQTLLPLIPTPPSASCPIVNTLNVAEDGTIKE